MATIRKRGARWQVQVRRNGSPLLTKSFLTRSNAEAWGRQKEVELDKGEVIQVRSDLKTIRLRDLLERYRTEITSGKRGAASEASRIGSILRRPIADLTLDKLTPSAVAVERDHRLKVVSPSSVRRELVILRHCLEIAIREWGVGLTANPVSRISKPQEGKSRTRRLEPDDLKALEAAFLKCRNPLIREVFLFALATGMRRGEILSLKWEHIDWVDRTALLPLTKNGESRIVPLSPAALAVLHRRQVTPLERLIGPQQPVIQGLVFPVTANGFRLAWERVKQRAGVEDLRFHDLRHEAISVFFELGLSVPEVALISGHRDNKMLFRYVHLRPDKLSLKLRLLVEDKKQLFTMSDLPNKRDDLKV